MVSIEPNKNKENLRESIHKPEKHYKKIVSKELRKTLSDETKETYKKQIDYLEKDVLDGKAIKIRVRPKKIRRLQKLLWVHDLKWWWYWWSTIYLWHASDLFNPQIVRHEWIHVIQQKELWWFIPWLIENAKEIIRYKRKNKKTNPNIKYDLTTKIETELESYLNQLKTNYIADRKEKAFLKLWQKWLAKTIKTSNNKLDNEIIQSTIEDLKINLMKTKNFIDSEQVYQNLTELNKDLERLEKTRENKSNNIDEDNSTLWIFNYLDKIVDITRVIKVLKKKLEILDKKEYKFKSTTKLNYMIKRYQNDVAPTNIVEMMNNDYNDTKKIKWAIKEIIRYKPESQIVKILERKIETLEQYKKRPELKDMIQKHIKEINDEGLSQIINDSYTDTKKIQKKLQDIKKKDIESPLIYILEKKLETIRQKDKFELRKLKKQNYESMKNERLLDTLDDDYYDSEKIKTEIERIKRKDSESPIIKVLRKKLELIEKRPQKPELKDMIQEYYKDTAIDLLDDNFTDIETIKTAINNFKIKNKKAPIIKILEKKLKLLKKTKKFKPTKKLEKMTKLCENEIANENLSYMMENSFTDKELIKETIEKLEQKCHELRSQPTCIRLEDPYQIETRKNLDKKWEEEQIEKYGEKQRKKKLKEKERPKLLWVTIPGIYPDVKYKQAEKDKETID